MWFSTFIFILQKTEAVRHFEEIKRLLYSTRHTNHRFELGLWKEAETPCWVLFKVSGGSKANIIGTYLHDLKVK